MNSLTRITVIGSGNVAWHLSHLFVKNKIRIDSIISRSEKHAKELAVAINVDYSNSLSDILPSTDLVLLCVSDNVISELSAQLIDLDVAVAHTAGSVSIAELKCLEKNAGVFYPFQSFTKDINLGGVSFPVCVEANNAEMLNRLRKLAGSISEKVVDMSSEKRKKLHLSGVIVNNFTNYLYTEAYNYLDNNDICTELLVPIIQQTSEKLLFNHPSKLQTGPAIRGSNSIINNHIELLKDTVDLQELYASISDKIHQYYKNKNE